MDDLVRFVIVGMQRSGTTAINTCLSGHPGVSCPDSEVAIDPFFTRGLSMFLIGGRERFERRHAGYRGLFDAITAPARSSGEVAHGLKVAISSYENALDLFIAVVEHLPDVRVVVVQREDLVAQYASLLLARQSGLWHRDRGTRRDAPQVVSGDPAEFETYAVDSVRIRHLLERLEGSHRVLRMSYERDVAPGIDHGKLFDFLDLPSVEPTWLWTTKVSPPLEDFLEGVADLREVERQVLERDLADPIADVLDHISERNRTEDPLFLATRIQARIERGWPAAAERDVLSLVARAESLESKVAGQVHACASHLGMDEAALAALAAGRLADGSFLAQRAMTLSHAGRDAESLGDLGRAMTDDPRTAAPWWIEILTAGIERLDRGGELDTALSAIRSSGSACAVAVVECLVARQRGDRERADANLEAARTVDRALVVSLALEPSGPSADRG